MAASCSDASPKVALAAEMPWSSQRYQVATPITVLPLAGDFRIGSESPPPALSTSAAAGWLS